MPAPRESLSVADYSAELLRLVRPDDRSVRLRLVEALGQVLAVPMAARVSIPAFANSAMDGYAVRWADAVAVPVVLRVVGEVPAGSPADPAAGPGQCVRIMTGAPLPTFADTVVPVEHTDGGIDSVRIRSAPRAAGAHVRGVAEDIRGGDPIAAAGERLTPALLGALAAAGHTHVDVRRHPVVLVASTGDELVADGSRLARAQIRESNSIVLAAALARDGASPLTAPPLPDRADVLVEWLDRHAGVADLVILTGGASVGAYDIVRDVLTAHAGGTFRHVRMQPGKPQGWAVWPGGTPIIALPGNPLSAALSYEVLVRPLLDRILGASRGNDFTAVAGAGWSSPAGRQQLLPVRLSSDAGGRLLARPAHSGSSASHLVTSLATADAIAIVAEDVIQVAPCDPVTVRML